VAPGAQGREANRRMIVWLISAIVATLAFAAIPLAIGFVIRLLARRVFRPPRS